MGSTMPLEQLIERAMTGDVAAQLLLARTYRLSGQKSDAALWRRRAIASKKPFAHFGVAVELLEGEDASAHLATVQELLEAAATAGYPPAQRVLANLQVCRFGANAWPKALALLQAAAGANDKEAIRIVGLLMALQGSGVAESTSHLEKSARLGDGLAAFALLRRLQRGHAQISSDDANTWLDALRKRGHPFAAGLGLGTSNPRMPEAGLERDVSSVSVVPARPLPMRQDVSVLPRVWTIPALLTEEECDYLVGLAMPRLHPALVIDPSSGQAIRNPERNSDVAILRPFQQDLVLAAINHRLALAAGLPEENGEMASVLRYKSGQEYRPHFDFLTDQMKGPAGYHVSGQRVATLLVSLSSDFDGGETHFLSTGYKWKGSPGDALLFWNVDEHQLPVKQTRHAGLPVVSGEKWLLSKWYRERVYRY